MPRSPRSRSRRGDGASPAGRGAETRLVYSTAGGTPPAEPAPAEAAPRGRGRVHLRLERRGSGRVVTIVGGLPGTAAEIAALATELRALCGAGGTARGGEVELQGDQREKAAAALAARGLRVTR